MPKAANSNKSGSVSTAQSSTGQESALEKSIRINKILDSVRDKYSAMSKSQLVAEGFSKKVNGQFTSRASVQQTPRRQLIEGLVRNDVRGGR